MRVRAAVAATIAGMCVVAPADAAPSGVVRFTDVADDANLVNSQFVCNWAPFRSVTTCPPEARRSQPSGNVEPAADIRSVTVATTYATKRSKDRRGRVVPKRHVSGLRVELALSAPPKAGVGYTFAMAPQDCTRFHLYLWWPVGGAPETIFTHDCDGEIGSARPAPAKLVGSRIVFTLTPDDVYLGAPAAFTELRASTYPALDTPVSNVSAGTYDLAFTTAQFRYG